MLSLHSNGSSSTLCSGGNSFSDNGSPTTPPSEELKPHMPFGNSHYPDGLCLGSKIPVSSVRNKTNESLIDELSLCRNLSNVYISNGKEEFSNLRDFSVDRDRLLYRDCCFSGSNQTTIDKHGDYDNVRRGFFDHMRFQSPVPSNAMSFDGQMSPGLSGLQQEHNMGSLLGSRVSPRQADNFFPQFNYCNSSMNFPWQNNTKEQMDNYYLGGSPVSNFTTSLSGLPMAESLFYAQQDGMNLNEARGVLNLLNTPQMTSPRPHLSVENALHLGLPLSGGRTRTPLNIRIPQPGLESLTSDESFIIQGEALNHSVNKGFNPSRGRSKVALHEIGMSKRLGRSQLDGWHQSAEICDNAQSARINFPFSIPPKYNSLAEAQGYIYLLAKDQYGCRFLQRIFDEGTPKDVQIVFNEIINYVVELMVNPFGNYLMQKLLDVCNEEQRLQILLMVTAEPGQLVRISLNPHGTRVVQKLIETLKTRQQISLVISALEPGFLALIKDLNGNHVIQRCLQCLSHEDNKFIFVAAAKYCVDIAIHQHGCCVLQRCISHSIGKHRENLVAEISANGLLLSQDAYGNYVIQFILELRIPSATSNLISQFEGNYVHLSKQKFGSHVVEKCLMVFNDECQSRLIHELLSVPQFERLLQDPHANYVVQTAIRVSEGPIHNALVEAIESHKAISRNSPYSKRIFSQKLLKK
ncbi:putative pumilio like protein 7 [Quercus suber]|uniref:Pumilio like protein 7 n=2 Tax=Quercus suber TaxID=58331 RepID=A0AAW0LNB0_QUESU|nr:putative pumilio like 7, chloroplastic [Quercus suber]